MRKTPMNPQPLKPVLIATFAFGTLIGCTDTPFDFDLRGEKSGFDTSAAAQSVTAKRPKADSRGIISYPNYQVAVAKRGDTLNDVAQRIGLSSKELSDYNGIDPDAPLRKGEIIALPRRVAEPTVQKPLQKTPLFGNKSNSTSKVDVTTLAGSAIDRAEETPPAIVKQEPTNIQPKEEEPTRHKVRRGETAFGIARLYQVSPKALAQWNGLDSEFSLREGQYLLIPVAKQAPPKRRIVTPEIQEPGVGSPTPIPPSASKPLPVEEPVVAETTKSITPDLGAQTPSKSKAKMSYPVKGSIIRAYAKGRNDGIDIKGASNASVKAAQKGTVAAITKSGDGQPILVLRHANNILTVYTNVQNIAVKKGDQVSRDQKIATLGSGDDAYVHFEVRDGFDSLDPLTFLN